MEDEHLMLMDLEAEAKDYEAKVAAAVVETEATVMLISSSSLRTVQDGAGID